MTDHRIILLCVIPLVASLVSIALINRRAWSRLVGVMSFTMMLGLAFSLVLKITDAPEEQSVLVSQMGGWTAPFGISIIFDSLSGLLICAAAAVGLGAYIHSFSVLDPRTERRYYHPLMQMLMFGVNLSFMTGDLFGAIRDHTVLSQLRADGAPDSEAFARGVHVGFSHGEQLTHVLFGARTRALFGELAPEGLR